VKIQFSQWSIRNPIPPIVLFFVLTIAGIYCFKMMHVSNMPTFTIPFISVNVSMAGASPEEIESQITRKVENAVSGIPGIKHIRSDISMGSSSTTLEFYSDIDVDRAFMDTRSAIANIRSDLPASVEEPLVQRIDIDGGAVAIYTIVAAGKSIEELSDYVDETLTRELMTVPGVAQVTRVGGVDREITVELKPEKLAAFGTNAAEISRQLAKVQVNMPGGSLTVNNMTFRLRTLAGVDTIESLESLIIPLANGRHLQLGHVADIGENRTELRTLSRLDGKPAVSFSVFRAKGAGEVQVVQQVDDRLQQFSVDNPGVQFKKIFSLARFTEETYSAAVSAFFEGTLLTIAVIFVFLRDRRSTLIAAVTIPLSIIPTFVVMYWLGFNINSLSMLAISMVIGVLVDDAIVEIENVHRHMAMGKKPFEAAMIAVDEIGLAVIATTAVICAIFLPVGFMPGIPGLIFKQFGLTVAIAAFFSLLVARLITPMLCAYLLKEPRLNQTVKRAKYGRTLLLYKRLVVWSLRHRLITVLTALGCLVASFALLPLLSLGYSSYEDYSYSVLKLELPYGSTLEQTDAMAMQVLQKLKERQEVEFVLTTVNGGVFGQHGTQQASIEIKLVPPTERALKQRDFEISVLKELKSIADVKLSFANIEGAKPISFALVGDNTDALYDAAKNVQRAMRQLSTISDVTSSIDQRQPEIIVRPKYAQAAQLGITTQQISEAILVATTGDVDAYLAKFNQGVRQIPIRVRIAKHSYPQTDVLSNLTVYSFDGQPVSLSAVADFTIGSGPNSIERYARQRMVTLDANLNDSALGDAIYDIMSLPIINDLPEGIRLHQFGESEMMDEMNRGFMFAIVAGLMMVYFVQVLLYKDWIQPFTRMMALPLSIGGAFLLLLLTGTELNMSAIIGMLMLMAIVDKNSILLVDYMLERVHHGTPKNKAIVEGCMVRARPIIMTSLAMLASMVPIVLGFAEQSAFRAPMAIAVIGGLLSSTALSLIFVPVFFSYVCDFERWFFPKIGKIVR
jgi:multidrug efflux pump subunit AcrB